MHMESKLWYTKPAASWFEALPLGNGRLGAMVGGGVQRESIQLNEETIWSGGFRDRVNPDARQGLAEIRALLRQGEAAAAEALARRALSGTPEWQRVYQTLGELELLFPGLPARADGYERSLCLETAVAETRFCAGGHAHTRTMFASAPANVLVLRLATDAPGGLCFDARVVRSRLCEASGKTPAGAVYFTGAGGGEDGIGFCCMLAAEAEGGSVAAVGETLVFQNVASATLYLTAASTFRCENPMAQCEATLAKAMATGYAALHREHIRDYQRLEARMAFHLEGPDTSALPTDERLARFKETPTDPGLTALYFRYGRYLLISSSRPGTLPATLQGLWCNEILPMWDSKYTININTQMNYWPAELCGLSECHTPLFDHLKAMHPRGMAVARNMYGARGFVAHHNTDIWGDCAPQDTWVPSTYWVMGAAWLCLHIWEHYEYTLDERFLREHYYLLRDACLFFTDILTPNHRGELVVSPTVSPENTYILPDGTEGCLCDGCSMDSQILTELFGACAKAAAVLGVDEAFAAGLHTLAQKLPPIRVGRHGTIQEWPEDYAEAEPGHRHISQLFALYPGSGISPEATPALAEAARKTIKRRLAHGGGHTGWSCAWIAAFWARLGDGKRLVEYMDALLTHSTLPNLFDSHPPIPYFGNTPIFQIDGNLGGTAAMASAVMQSSREQVRLLGALPPAWPTGCVRGLRAKGGLIWDIAWQDGRLQTARVAAGAAYCGTVQYGPHTRTLHLAPGEALELNERLEPATLSNEK